MFRNGLYNIGGQVLRGALSLLTIPLLVRLLGLHEYGVWSLSYAVLALMTLGEGGIPVAAAFFLSKDLAAHDSREVSRTATTLAVAATGFSAALALLLWFVGPVVVRSLAAFSDYERAIAGKAIQRAALAVSILILERTLVGFEQAFDKYALTNVLDVVQAAITNAGFIVIAWFGGKADALMDWQVVASAAVLAAHCFFVCRLLAARWSGLQWSSSKTSGIIRYSLAAWSSALGSAAFTQCDQLIVGGVLGAGPLGIYSAITSICSKINSFSATVVQPLVPALSRGSSREETEVSLRHAARLNALIATQTGIILYVMADWVLRIVLSHPPDRVYVLGLEIAAGIYALYSLNAPGYYILFSIGEARTNAMVVLSCGLISLCFIFIGARYWGFLGAISGNVAFVASLCMVNFGLRKLRIAMTWYLRWISVPVICLIIAPFAVQGFLSAIWWRLVFLAIEASILLVWFARDQGSFRKGPLSLGPAL